MRSRIRPEIVGCAALIAMVGLGQAVALERARVEAQHELEELGRHRHRHPVARRELVDGPPEEVLRDDPRAAARGEVRRARDVARLDGDVHRAVAHPEHDDVLAFEDAVVAVVVGVQLRALEVLAAGERRLGPARVPVMAVGDEQHVVVGAARRRRRSAPSRRRRAARRARSASRSGSCRGSRTCRRRTRSTPRSACGAGSPGTTRGIGKSEYCHAVARGVDVQVAVGGRHPVAVARRPSCRRRGRRPRSSQTGSRARAAPWRPRSRTTRRR